MMLQTSGQSSVQFKERYLDSLLSGDATHGAQIINQALGSGLSPSQVYLQVLMPSQREVGERWHAGKLNVAQEHLATQITLQEMTRLRTISRPKSSLGVRAVIATVDGDAHFLGGRVVADFFYMDGWEVDYLGTNTPSSELVKFAAERKADLVGVSVTMQQGLEEVRALIAELKKLPSPPKVMIGGPVFGEDSSIAKTLGADAVAKDALHAVQEARRVCGLSGSQASLSQFLKGLGERILENRKGRKFSQQELANRANLDRAYISSVENGKQNLTIGAIFKLSEALEIPLEDLLVGRK